MTKIISVFLEHLFAILFNFIQENSLECSEKSCTDQTQCVHRKERSTDLNFYEVDVDENLPLDDYPALKVVNNLFHLYLHRYFLPHRVSHYSFEIFICYVLDNLTYFYFQFSFSFLPANVAPLIYCSSAS